MDPFEDCAKLPPLALRQTGLHTNPPLDEGVEDQAETGQALPECLRLGRNRCNDRLDPLVFEVARDQQAGCVGKTALDLKKVAAPSRNLNPVNPGGCVIANWQKLQAGNGQPVAITQAGNNCFVG